MDPREGLIRAREMADYLKTVLEGKFELQPFVGYKFRGRIDAPHNEFNFIKLTSNPK